MPTNYCEVSPYMNPQNRLGALLNVSIPSTCSSADGSERSIILGRIDGVSFVYGGPINKLAIERYNVIKILGVPDSVSNREIIRLFEKCFFRDPFIGNRNIITFHEFLTSQKYILGYRIENRNEA